MHLICFQTIQKKKQKKSVQLLQPCHARKISIGVMEKLTQFDHFPYGYGAATPCQNKQ
mgnify:CR=1 FL=1